MRRKKEAVLCFASNDEGLPKVVRDYRARYRVISQVLDKNSEILDLVHEDLKKLSQGGRKGRKGDFTSENILRALIVQNMEGLPFREAVIRIGSDDFLQGFLRMRKKAVMDFTFLDKCFLAIRPETWKRVNALLGRYGVGQGAVNPKVIRADTTVVESNIHYPTDSSLLWDAWRVASRLLRRARSMERESVPHRFHTRKIKKLHLFITRYIISKSKSRQQQVRTSFRTLIERVEWMVGLARDFCGRFCSSSNLELAGVALELRAYLPAMEQVVAVARRMQDFMDKLLAHCQAFRAGIEGTISRLKRAFRLFRCLFRGFKGFARNVGLGVFSHNLIVLAEHEAG
jgi:IS5 family transposase